MKGGKPSANAERWELCDEHLLWRFHRHSWACKNARLLWARFFALCNRQVTTDGCLLTNILRNLQTATVAPGIPGQALKWLKNSKAVCNCIQVVLCTCVCCMFPLKRSNLSDSSRATLTGYGIAPSTIGDKVKGKTGLLSSGAPVQSRGTTLPQRMSIAVQYVCTRLCSCWWVQNLWHFASNYLNNSKIKPAVSVNSEKWAYPQNISSPGEASRHCST